MSKHQEEEVGSAEKGRNWITEPWATSKPAEWQTLTFPGGSSLWIQSEITPAKANSTPYHWRLQNNVRLPHRRDSKLNRRRNELFSLNGQCSKDAHGKGLLLFSAFQNCFPYMFSKIFIVKPLGVLMLCIGFQKG